MGQCYDGADNMSGPCNGAAAIVKWQYRKAVYTHCMAYHLNLSVMSACKKQSVRNMFDTVGEITRSFEYSSKKEALLVQKVKDVCPESSCHKLLDGLQGPLDPAYGNHQNKCRKKLECRFN